MHYHHARVVFRVWVGPVEVTMVTDGVIGARDEVSGDVHYPGPDILTIAPAVTPVQPGTVFVGRDAAGNILCAAKRGPWKSKSHW